MSQNLRYYRDLSPAEKFKAFFFYNDLEHFFRLSPFDLMLGEEELANAVFSFLSDLYALFFAGFFEEFMGNLKKDSNTVTGFALCVFSCTMVQILYDPECICNCIMGFFSFNIDHGSDTTVVVFKFLAVKSLPFLSHFSHFPHPFYC